MYRGSFAVMKIMFKPYAGSGSIYDSLYIQIRGCLSVALEAPRAADGLTRRTLLMFGCKKVAKPLRILNCHMIVLDTLFVLDIEDVSLFIVLP